MKNSVLGLVLFSLFVLPVAGRAGEDPFASFPGTSFAIAHVSVIDGLGTAAKRDWTVIVTNGVIDKIGPSSTTPIDSGTHIVDGRGRTLMPGIVGMHEHLYYEVNEKMAAFPTMVFSAPKLYLAAGVTTARTTGSLETYAELNLKSRIDAGTEPGPTLDVSGPYLSGANDPIMVQQAALTSPQDARETVDFWTARGVTSFKAFLAITSDELQATIDEAHAKGALVEGHLCAVTESDAADLGIDELEHGIFGASDFVVDKKPDVCPPIPALIRSYLSLQSSDPRIAALIQKLVVHHVAVTSTLAVLNMSFGLTPSLNARKLAVLDGDARAAYLAQQPLTPAQAPKVRHMMSVEMAFERAFVAAGGLLTEGADAGVGNIPGFADQSEIELLHTAGFTPDQAIEIATANGARAMHRFDKIGSIEPGKTADLLLVNGDLESDITAIERPVLVVHAGRAYDPQKLIDAVKGSVGQQ